MTLPTQPSHLEDSQAVMRRVRESEVTTDSNNGPLRPSSDAFIQDGPDGPTSVYLASETTPERITQGYPKTYVAEVEIGAIRALGLDVQRDPVPDDTGHCNITGRKTRSKARAIARSSRWAEGYEPL